MLEEEYSKGGSQASAVQGDGYLPLGAWLAAPPASGSSCSRDRSASPAVSLLSSSPPPSAAPPPEASGPHLSGQPPRRSSAPPFVWPRPAPPPNA